MLMFESVLRKVVTVDSFGEFASAIYGDPFYGKPLVILDSLEGAAKVNVEVLPLGTVQAAQRRYYLAVPSWASGDAREASEIVLTPHSQELRRTAARS